MSRRQEYWQDLRIIHSATSKWNRRMSFTAAREWVLAYQDDIVTGHNQHTAAQRAYDYLVYNSRSTLVSRSEMQWTY